MKSWASLESKATQIHRVASRAVDHFWKCRRDSCVHFSCSWSGQRRGADETPGKKRVATRTDSAGGDGLPWGQSKVPQSQERPERTGEEGPFR